MWKILIIFISHVHLVRNIVDHDCPYGWVRYVNGNRCYRFVWYPQEDLDGARSYCRRFHSELLGVETMEEHEFIRSWLKGNALNRHQRWLTSGEFLNEEWIWNQQVKKTIKDINGWHQNITFVNDKSHVENTLVVYSHTSAENWKWDRYYSKELPFICEIDRDDSYKIEIDEFPIDYGKRPIQMSTKLEIERAPTISQSIFNVKFFDLNDVRRFGQKKNFLLIVPLQCESDGFPLPTIEWYKVINSYDGTGLKKQRKIVPTDDLHMLSTNGMLYIEEPNSTDTGNYVCIGRNDFGSVMSAPISLSRAILSDLEEFGRPDLLVTENSKAIVTCLSNTKSKDIEFTYSWSRNGIVQDVLQNEEQK
ncbi:hypothetical protein SNEBB_002491 [Seison nebaliae]|nr:hypothetical protein SNEBB_002491 [Seison nebaliae]